MFSQNFLHKVYFIENYQFDSSILERLKKDFNYSDYKLDLISETLKDYFICHLLRKELNSPSFLTLASFHADQLWHWFILFTPQYREFCDLAFGSYLDHVPTTGPVPTKSFKDQSYFNTLELLKIVKSFRTYSNPDFNKLNSIDSFYSIFSLDYIIQDFSFSDAILKSLDDLS